MAQTIDSGGRADVALEKFKYHHTKIPEKEMEGEQGF